MIQIHHTVAIRAPEYHIADAPWGTTYAGYRAAGPGRTSWRFGNFLFPFWTQVPNGESAVTCRFADGYRSTMSTLCTVCCGGSAAYRP